MLIAAPCMQDAGTVDGCSMAAGLSLGEYCALVFAGAMSFEDGLQVRLSSEMQLPCHLPD